MDRKQKEKIINKAYRLGKEYEGKYRGCSQCTLGALEDAFKLEKGELFTASTALAGGGGLTTASGCGGFTGGALFIGKFLGRSGKDFKKISSSKSGIFTVVKELHERFAEKYGSVICRDIQRKIFGRSFNLFDSQEKQKFNEMGAHIDKCPLVVANAAKWTAELILKEHIQLFESFEG